MGEPVAGLGSESGRLSDDLSDEDLVSGTGSAMKPLCDFSDILNKAVPQRAHW